MTENKPINPLPPTGPEKNPESLRTRMGWLPILIGVAGLAIFAMVAYAIHAGTAVDDASTKLAISNQMSNILEVNPLMTLGTPAPAFTLTDQNGSKETLSSFAGKSVVLTFGDDKCTDLCTPLAADVLAADKDLGPGRANVEFVSINANTFYPTVAATKAWTDSHGLAHTSNWHFLTGSPKTLTALAKTYGVEIDLDQKTRTIAHGAEMFFISPTGDEEQIGDFGTESANTAEFSHSMAQLAIEMLPTKEHHAVAGPTGTAQAAVDTSIGSTPPPIELPSLGTGTAVTTTSYRGKYVVLNFWSPSCSICVTELPAIQRAHKNLGSSADIVGIDASDPTSAGVGFAARAGVTYPQLLDSQGTVAAQYEIPGFPYTIILDPTGKVVVRHPGVITAEQLEYVLNPLIAEAPTG
jgi:cytochrome oxidase Cu insertion factor (SCO1/SenC/PrrC family)/thiol-disulfide isomerase/thioredoxin